ncbi:hypothetical protein SAMN05878482_1195 [Peribacillus simplex]|uniref:Uncharacterized protein n=1 Tax=Peribacillus simplex TaxID=1478 RepID=A0A9X8RF33_9BACI|nr:hypothetical protein SAMN05878482_1195 [Peribacillus simplex]
MKAVSKGAYSLFFHFFMSFKSGGIGKTILSIVSINTKLVWGIILDGKG